MRPKCGTNTTQPTSRTTSRDQSSRGPGRPLQHRQRIRRRRRPIPSTPSNNPPASGVGPASTTIALSGQVAGTQPLDGSGTVGPLGAVTSTGTLSASGAEPMNYSGTATLVGSFGSVTLSLSGRVFGPVSIGQTVDLTYTITGGTGAYQDATGSGQAVLSFTLPSGIRTNPSPAPNSFVLAFS